MHAGVFPVPVCVCSTPPPCRCPTDRLCVEKKKRKSGKNKNKNTRTKKKKKAKKSKTKDIPSATRGQDLARDARRGAVAAGLHLGDIAPHSTGVAFATCVLGPRLFGSGAARPR